MAVYPMMPMAPIRPGGYTVTTRVDGNVATLRDTETWLRRLAAEALSLHDTTGDQITRLRTAWEGTAGDACRTTLDRQKKGAHHLRAAAVEVADAVGTFATEIMGVKAEMATARTAARAAGYSVTAEAIHLPMVLTNPAATVVNGVNITSTVTAARQREVRAHAELNRVLSKHTTFLDFFRKSMPTRTVTAIRGAFTATMGTRWYKDSANARTKVLAAATIIAENADGGLRVTAYRDIANRLPRYLTDKAAAAVNETLTARPFHFKVDTAPDAFFKSFHYSGGVITGAGIGYSIMNGTPADKAIGVGVASWAGGALASGGAAAGLTALGVSAGPIGWAALGVGLVASAGVGYIVDHNWDDITSGIENLFN